MNAQQKQSIKKCITDLGFINQTIQNIVDEINGEDGPSEANQDASDTLDGAMESIQSVSDDLDTIVD